jgi:hypothetical protein
MRLAPSPMTDRHLARHSIPTLEARPNLRTPLPLRSAADRRWKCLEQAARVQ